MIRRIRGQRPLESRHPHFPLRDPNSHADYLLRAWPDPRCFRRGWGQTDWVELDPPLLAWSSDAQADTWFDPLRAVRRPSRPEQGKLFDDDATRLLPGALDGFWGSVPAEVSEPLRDLPTGTWPLLRLACLDTSLVDLLQSNLALAVGLAHLEHFTGEPIWNRRQRQLELARRRQHEALGELGFPSRRSVRRVLGRIEPQALTVEALLQLQRAYRRQQAGVPLTHLPRINAGALALVCDETTAGNVPPQLLQEVAGRADELAQPRAAFLLRDSLWMLQELERDRGGFRPHGVEQLETLHDELARELRRLRYELRHREEARRLARVRATIADREAERVPLAPTLPPPPEKPRRPRRFPDPPIPDAEGQNGLRTRALRSARELRAWASAQRHCGGIYESRCRAGTDYLYAVLAPEPATAGLVWSPHRGWRLEQLAGQQNRPVLAQTADAIGLWLEANGATMVPVRTL